MTGLIPARRGRLGPRRLEWAGKRRASAALSCAPPTTMGRIRTTPLRFMREPSLPCTVGAVAAGRLRGGLQPPRRHRPELARPPAQQPRRPPSELMQHLVGASVRPPAPLQGDGPYMGASGPQRCGGLHGETLHRGSPAPLCEPKTLNPAPLRGSSPPPVQPLPDSSHGRTPRRAARTSDSPPRAAGARRKGPRANL